MSMHKLVGGDGYSYLTRQVAAGDATRNPAEPLVAYYDATGTPPGRWAGAGLRALGDPAHCLRPGTVVTEAAMAAVFRDGHDPITLQPLGRDYTTRTRPVVGYDLTFTAPKSAAILWALGTPDVHAQVVAAHHAAVAQALTVVEATVIRTRVGAAGRRQVATAGMIAAAFDHYDTRAGDPGLHTHVVIANKVQGPDQQWRSLDGTTIHAATVAISALYDAFLADELHRRLRTTWAHRPRGTHRNPAYEITGIDDTLLAVFSTRSHHIHDAEQAWVADFTAAHGRHPTRVETMRARQHLTRITRPPKTTRPLTELLAEWANRARALTGRDPHDLAAQALTGDYTRGLHAHDIGPTTREALTATTLADATEHRSVFTTWNLRAAATRATLTLGMHDPTERTRLIDQLVDQTAATCVRLDTHPDSLTHRPGHELFTTTDLLAAEHTLLDAAEATDYPHPASASEARYLGRDPNLAGPTPDQSAAVRAILTSPRRLDVLVGAAGTGKTTTLSALVETAHRLGYPVVGLAPSASAAHTLGDALNIPTETTAKWLYEACGPGAAARAAVHDQAMAALADGTLSHTAASAANDARWQARAEQDSWRFTRGQIVLVDEASLADTRTLATLVQLADQADAKVVLVGDHLQRGAVGAGGAFGMLARRGPTAELTALHRFSQPWEARASLELRHGQPTALETYAAHGAITEGDLDALLDRALDAADAATRAGRVPLLQAADLRTVRELNARARQRAVLAGTASPGGVTLRDGLVGGVGDRVLTRRNERHLRTRDGYVRNGTLWTITAAHPDGSIDARPLRDGHTDPDEAPVHLPARYVAEHVELGYAVTTARSQGLTVDESHTIATPSMGREDLYVALTRGRHANHVYVATDLPDEDRPPGLPLGAPTRPTGREVLERILATTHAELSATETWASFHPLDDAPAPPPGRTHTQSPRYLAELEAAGVLPTSRPRSGIGAGYPATAAGRSIEGVGL